MSTQGRWARTRRRWLRLNPTAENGLYTCAWCGQEIAATQLSLDHIIRVEDVPQFRHNLENLRPMHAKCNSTIDRLMSNEQKLRRYFRSQHHFTAQNRACIIATNEAYKKYAHLLPTFEQRTWKRMSKTTMTVEVLR